MGELFGLRIQTDPLPGRLVRRQVEEDAEKVPRAIKSVPQRLKPRCEQSTFGTAEAVPLSKTDFFSTL
jgi:hypothetical protein